MVFSVISHAAAHLLLAAVFVFCSSWVPESTEPRFLIFTNWEFCFLYSFVLEFEERVQLLQASNMEEGRAGIMYGLIALFLLDPDQVT